MALVTYMAQIKQNNINLEHKALVWNSSSVELNLKQSFTEKELQSSDFDIVLSRND